MKLQLNYGRKTWTSSLDIGDKQQLSSYPISHLHNLLTQLNTEVQQIKRHTRFQIDKLNEMISQLCSYVIQFIQSLIQEMYDCCLRVNTRQTHCLQGAYILLKGMETIILPHAKCRNTRFLHGLGENIRQASASP